MGDVPREAEDLHVLTRIPPDEDRIRAALASEQEES